MALQWEVDIWCFSGYLVFLWMLELGAWCFVPAIAETTAEFLGNVRMPFLLRGGEGQDEGESEKLNDQFRIVGRLKTGNDAVG